MKDRMLIGEVCIRAQCSPRTVRHYKAEKLIHFVAKTPGGHRLYDEQTVSIICLARLLKRLGFSIKAIRQVINLTDSKDTRNERLTKRLRNILSDTISKIDAELALLSRSREKISSVFEETRKCDACESVNCDSCLKLKNLRTLGLLEKGLN